MTRPAAVAAKIAAESIGRRVILDIIRRANDPPALAARI
jgi:hypothetical protein